MQGVHQIMAIKQQIWKHVTANIQLDTTKQNWLVFFQDVLETDISKH